MANYIAVDKNDLIVSIIAVSKPITDTDTYRVIEATQADIDTYLRLKKKSENVFLVDLQSAKVKVRTKRNITLTKVTPWSRLSKNEKELHRADMLRQLKSGRSIEQTAYIFACSEAEVKRFLDL